MFKKLFLLLVFISIFSFNFNLFAAKEASFNVNIFAQVPEIVTIQLKSGTNVRLDKGLAVRIDFSYQTNVKADLYLRSKHGGLHLTQLPKNKLAEGIPAEYSENANNTPLIPYKIRYNQGKNESDISSFKAEGEGAKGRLIQNIESPCLKEELSHIEVFLNRNLETLAEFPSGIYADTLYLTIAAAE